MIDGILSARKHFYSAVLRISNEYDIFIYRLESVYIEYVSKGPWIRSADIIENRN